MPVNEAATLEAIKNSDLSVWIRDTWWAFPTFETLHFVGLCLFLGAMLIVDLRLMGVFKTGAMRDAVRFTYVAIPAFGLNLVTGALMAISNPAIYAYNPTFWVKLVLLATAGINVAFFELVERKRVIALAEGEYTAVSIKIIAALSLLLWASIIAVGRLLPVTGIG